MNYRAELLHSRLQSKKSEGRTHLKVNYNDHMPFVAGLHWKELISKASLRRFEGDKKFPLVIHTPYHTKQTPSFLHQPKTIKRFDNIMNGI